jgi:hypothetical protein
MVTGEEQQVWIVGLICKYGFCNQSANSPFSPSSVPHPIRYTIDIFKNLEGETCIINAGGPNTTIILTIPDTWQFGTINLLHLFAKQFILLS